MTEHPITPPPELMEAWSRAVNYNEPTFAQVAIKAARWGADQELDECCEWVSQFNYDDYSYQERLRAARRRPKPPSLKEQSLALIDKIQGSKEAWDISDLNVVRRAIESLPS